MTIQYFISQIKKYWRQIAIIFFLSSVLGFFTALVQTPKYASESRLLIINYNADVLKSFQSSEALGNLLAEIIYSQNFFKKVISGDEKINKKYFPVNNKRKLKKAWKDTVEMKTINSSGFLEVKIFHPSFVQAQLLNESFNINLINYAQKIYPRAKIEILDPPSLSDMPVKPNILASAFIFGIFGLIIFLISLYAKNQFAQNNNTISNPSSD